MNDLSLLGLLQAALGVPAMALTLLLWWRLFTPGVSLQVAVRRNRPILLLVIVLLVLGMMVHWYELGCHGAGC
jgi:hypothetical protein